MEEQDAAKACPVHEARNALEGLVRLDQAPPGQPPAGAALRALRLLIELDLGRGGPDHLAQLNALAGELRQGGDSASQAMAQTMAQTLDEALATDPAHWQAHAQGRACPAPAGPPLLAPCHAACPAGIDIPSFIAQVGQGRHAEAVATIRQDNPLPYICGLICPAPCEHFCLRAERDQAISIRAMKAVAAEGALAAGGYPRPATATATGKRVAVIGAGPAGLSCAWFLTLKGHGVTIFEAQPVVGGTMFLGIPSYRLPREAIAADVKGITDAGVEIVTGQALGADFSLDDLRDRGYDAVFLGPGAHCGYRLGLAGEADYPQVLDGITFLRAVALGDHTAPAEEVVIVGGGNAAMDAARTCVRLGCRKVTIAYRRTRAEMPAHHEEIEAALEEGVRMSFLTVPKAIAGENGNLTGLACVRAELGPPDASGRRRPVVVAGSDFVIEAGAVIAAIGQELDTTCLGPLAQDQSVCCRTIVAHPKSGQTTLGWLFAGGDAVTGPATVVEAVGAGKRAAQAMDAFLRGADPVAAVELPAARAKVPPVAMAGDQRGDLARPEMPVRAPAERAADFAAAELGLTPAMALGEARRCLRCDYCIGCGLCRTACAEVGAQALAFASTKADRLALFDFTRPGERCIACGACAAVCPTTAIRTFESDGRRQVVIAGAKLQDLPLLLCRQCGQPIAARPQLAALEERLDSAQQAAAPHLDGLCPACARLNGGLGFAPLLGKLRR